MTKRRNTVKELLMIQRRKLMEKSPNKKRKGMTTMATMMKATMMVKMVMRKMDKAKMTRKMTPKLKICKWRGNCWRCSKKKYFYIAIFFSDAF